MYTPVRELCREREGELLSLSLGRNGINAGLYTEILDLEIPFTTCRL